jgi:hypothetical protein
LKDSVPVIGPSIAAFAFLRFQKFRNYKESMSAEVSSQKQLSDQTIANQTNLKGDATRTVDAGSGKQTARGARSTSPTNARETESEPSCRVPLFSILAGPPVSEPRQSSTTVFRTCRSRRP